MKLFEFENLNLIWIWIKFNGVRFTFDLWTYKKVL